MAVKGLFAAIGVVGLAVSVHAGVPTYSVEVVDTYQTTTTLTGASEAGHFVGWQVVNGLVRGFVAVAGEGIEVLPLPDGYQSSTAMGVNRHGVVVGAVAMGGFPFDGGEPAIWTPDGAGGYAVAIPQQFDTVPSPLGGVIGVNGGMAVDINDAGTVVGWSRYQGFQGGPTTVFSLTDPPANINALGFEATVEDINENGVLVGGRYLFDLNAGVATQLDLPAPVGTVSFANTIGYAINDSNEIVSAARRATSTNDLWLTYLHDPAEGWSPLNPAQLPSRFVGFYDNNNRGDVSATGGVLFADEGVLVGGFDGLLDPADANWDTSLGYIGNDRRVYTTAIDTDSGANALVVLVPDSVGCNPADLTGDGVLDLADVNAFIAAFTGGEPAGDLTGDGVFDLSDIQAFVDAFVAGCPA